MIRTAGTVRGIARAPPESPERQGGSLLSGADSRGQREKHVDNRRNDRKDRTGGHGGTGRKKDSGDRKGATGDGKEKNQP